MFHFGMSPRDILTGFREGRFSIAWDLLPNDVEDLRRDPDFASGYNETPRLVTYYVAFNTTRARWPTGRCGCAWRAVDVPQLVRQTLGRAIPALGLIPPGLLGHGPGGLAPEPASGAARHHGGGLELTAAVHPVFIGPYAAFARELSSVFAA